MESSLIIGDVRKMRIKGATDLQMRAKFKKRTAQQALWGKTDTKLSQVGEYGVNGHLYSVIFFIVCCSYLCWCLLHSSVIAWWSKILSCTANYLWTNMTFILLMLFSCVLVAYEMIHNINAKGSKTDCLINDCWL